jgi:acyl-CoA dehydrogenase
MPGALDIHLSEAELALLDETMTLARHALAPIAAAGEEGRVNLELLRALGARGLLGRVLRPDVSAMDLCLIREGLARACTEAETALAVQGLGARPVLQWGSEALAEIWRDDLAAGDIAAGFALTEPGAGSDVAALSLTAERAGEDWILSGEKAFISNAPDAAVYSVFARTGPGEGAGGLTAFAVTGDSEGLQGERIDLVSPHPIGRLRFERVHVPDVCVLGEVGGGFRVAMATLDLFRPSVGAFAIGMAQAALDAALHHAGERHAFGRPLRDFQAVSHRLADVATRVQAARLLVHQAARAYDAGERGRDYSQAAAMAKLLATEVAQDAVDAAVQVHGARALERGHLLEHLYREVRAPRIYEGASEIQREIIARRMFAASGG